MQNFTLDQIEKVEENAIFVHNNKIRKAVTRKDIFKRHAKTPFYYVCFRGGEYRLTSGGTYVCKHNGNTLEYSSPKVLEMYKEIKG